MPHDATLNPGHYTGFSHGAETIDISEHLSSNAGQAVGYVVRSCRTDAAERKGEDQRDISKALWFLTRELHRRFGDEAVREAVTQALHGSRITDPAAFLAEGPAEPRLPNRAPDVRTDVGRSMTDDDDDIFQ